MMIQLLSNYTFLVIIVGTTLFCGVASAIGTISVLKGQSLIGDAISHATLPGIVLMFLLFQSKNVILFMIGAILAGILAYSFIQVFASYTKIDLDTILAIILTTFFGFGIVLLSYISKFAKSAQSGIGNYIFGSVATMRKEDVYIIVFSSLICVLFLILFYKEIKVFVFDETFAKISGFAPHKLHIIILGMTMLVISVGIQSVGVVLVSAILIAPAVTALQWSNRFNVVLIIASIVGMISSVLGVLISSLYPKVPTGATIVIVASLMALCSIIFGKNGILFGESRR